MKLMEKSKGILYFLREVSIVVIGVLIAVSIGNYKESEDNAQYLEKTLIAIENEIEISQIELDTVLKRHIRLYEILESEIGENDRSLGELVSGSGGFQVASIKNVSLRFFVSNKAELLEFELISQLLEIELMTGMLSDKIKLMSDFVYDHVNEGNDEVKIKFAYLLANIIDGEQTLLKAYSSFLENNNNDLKKLK
tara:strand:- start:557 stop:1141 length:585 start_codon:yes stop_codon:yes gene_type:complete